MNTWRVYPLKRLCHVDSSGVWGAEPDACSDPTPVCTTAHISSEGNFDVDSMPRRCLSAEELDRYVCRSGDLIVVKASGSADNVVSGKCGLVRNDEQRFAFGNFLMRLRPRTNIVRSAFLYHVVTSAEMRESIKVAVLTTTYPNLQLGEYLNFKARVPDLGMQDLILDALEVKLREITLLLSNRRRLVTALQEQKRAIFSRAVTRGINPDAPMKHSGLDWLGEMPAHWESRRAKYYFNEIDERSLSGAEELLSVSHITGVTPRSEKNITMFMAESYEGSKLCRPGDLVINIMWAWMGACGVSRHHGIVSPSYGIYRPRDRELFNPKYLDLLSRSIPYVAEYNCRSKGITSSRLRMYSDEFLNLRIVRPPIQEQVEILKHIDVECSRIDGAIARANREIELIEEFRTTLISEVVTGKRDIHQLAALKEPL